ncbi:TetR/AcrR family transcriptional regulator [Gordonia aichiensis]|uniref:Putative TetR family transcriptional regulator n=1 Tax=Gordonia aichiensis NBRC 108223 TaxID=1220583 RepID=L7KLT3_9ACTN|nr:TetR/AcrR family transcriptional regulator [Gordonia aichiensis]GAC48668.1 putative TetR family transcriptional regulator [Gordonia aichiensis NBRC 108223]
MNNDDAMSAIRQLLISPDSDSEQSSVVTDVLEAAVGVILTIGWQRLTMADVAKRAGVARATVYRHFATKDDLRRAVGAREVQKFLLEILELRSAAPDLESGMVAAVRHIINEVRTNPLIARLRETDRELLMDVVSRDDIVTYATQFCAQMWRTQLYAADDEIAEADWNHLLMVSEITVRVSLSLALNPTTSTDLSTEEGATDFVRRFTKALLPDA